MSGRHLILAMVVNLLWGLNFLATRFAVDEMPPVLAASLRFLIVLLVLLPFLKPEKTHMRALLQTALVIGVFHFGLLYIGIAWTKDLSVAAVGTLMNVPFATLLAVAILGERIGAQRTGGILIAVVGVVILSFNPRVLDYIDGLLIVLVAVFGYAVGIIMMRRLPGVHPLSLQAWMALLCFPILLGISLVAESGQLMALKTASAWAYGGIVFSALGASVVGHGLNFYLLQRYPVTTVAPLTLLSQLVAIVGGLVVFDDVLKPGMIAGGIFIFAGVAVVSYRNRKRSLDIEITAG